MNTESFLIRHIGPRDEDIKKMLKVIKAKSLDELIDQTLPNDIKLKENIKLDKPLSESEYLTHLKKISALNKVFKSYIGLGYNRSYLPAVIQRNILENPGWYTAYTPYQAEISQGRMEALLNFQTMITDLTGMEISNASLLDESTAAAEAMTLLYAIRDRDQKKNNVSRFFVSKDIFPQTLSVLNTRSKPIGIELVVGSIEDFKFDSTFFGALIQYPGASGEIKHIDSFISKCISNNIKTAVAADILSLVLLESPGKLGVDVVVGTTQRFGIPLGYGGPHAGYFATKKAYKRNIPGRIIGVSIDCDGDKALRMALQTREQHIKRDRATSNICTAQVLLAVMAGMYAVYHGPEGLREIANKVHYTARTLSKNLKLFGLKQLNSSFFDTIRIEANRGKIKKEAVKKEINFHYPSENIVSITINETTTIDDLNDIISVFSIITNKPFTKLDKIEENIDDKLFHRKTEFLTNSVFNSYHSETELMRYIKSLENKDLALNRSMISLGSCTMKLNAAAEMLPLSWNRWGNIHPFAPNSQTKGYDYVLKRLENQLKEITGFSATSLQPNSGAQGEYAGLMVIKAFHESNGDFNRNICLIPSSAHGTNPASAVMAGMKVIVVKANEKGNIDIDDLRAKAIEHKENLAALMITYPSTHGVFETNIIEITNLIHNNGGQVYMDGANMNAQVGITNPKIIGADVCHLNLHKTFAIPHGGGGPGMGPICVAKHLTQYLPGHPNIESSSKAIHAVSGAPIGSGGILPISWAYIAMLGNNGLKLSTQVAILNANYMAHRLKDHFPILYRGTNGYSAHEFILDLRPLKRDHNISDEDVAKRLIDYGYHAPTMSFPVPGTLMIEPTESESKRELDQFCDAMILIKKEIQDIIDGKLDKNDNPLTNAPHTAQVVSNDNWDHAYSRTQAAYPAKWLKEHKYWPSVGRVDNAYGDRNLVCTCPVINEY